MENEMSTATPKLTKRDLNRVFLRIHAIQVVLNYDMQQGIGFFNCMVPILERLYGDADIELKKNARDRHLTLFLSQVTATGMILGLVGALEETAPEEGKTEAVAAIKTGMMGPMAGIGDSLFKITVQAISGSIGAALALQGNFLGPIIMFVLYVGINETIKYLGIHKSYSLGMTWLSGDNANQIIERLIKAAGVLGLTVIGSLIASSVKLDIGTVIKVQDTKIVLQELLDSLMPKILPLVFTTGLFFLFKKIDRKYMVVVIFTILVIGTMLAMFNILA
ncbi:PTS system mannose/fructose/sorbose family transporter subunit IID [Enterococcus sp. AZ109]|uniref:PTS system mannose/fructose/sorbose family transporter subunit IID n=1 Tax=Enterococcus sp. AZ109 TaxID=2774634 RepID=UPI003F2301B1